MRLFVAVAVPPEIREKIGRLIAELSKSEADFKWVETENLHLTLAFLGETKEENLPPLKEALEAACAGASAFDVSFGRLGVFSSWKEPRVLWLGIGAGADALARLSAQASQGLREKGFLAKKEDRPFKAHLTLGRMRGPRNVKKLKDAAERLDASRNGTLEFRADQIVLFESKRLSAGPIYGALWTTRLLENDIMDA